MNQFLKSTEPHFQKIQIEGNHLILSGVIYPGYFNELNKLPEDKKKLPLNVDIDSLKEANSYFTFLFKIDLKNKNRENGQIEDILISNGSGQSYTEALNYFAFQMKEKIKLDVAGVKTQLTSIHMERSFGMSTYRMFTAIFPTNLNKTPNLILDDVISGSGLEIIELENK